MLPSLKAEGEEPPEKENEKNELIFVVYLLPFMIRKKEGAYRVVRSQVMFGKPMISGSFTHRCSTWQKARSSTSSGSAS